MVSVPDLFKRLFVGRALASDRLGETELPKKLALPVFASDALSSVAYATEEILLVLSIGGIALYHYAPYLAGAVVLLMLVVVASYRQNVHAYPSGGGDYEVATTNLGPPAGVTVASALLVDYVLTVAVSVSAGVANITSAVRGLAGHEIEIAVIVVGVITFLNLRGLRESGKAFAVPTYGFIVGIGALLAYGGYQVASGHTVRAESAGFSVPDGKLAGLALLFLLLRAFASGCTALTGVEAISNGVPAFKKPKSKNAATTLAMMGVIAVTMFIGVTVLALVARVHVVDPDHSGQLVGAPAGYEQRTVVAQIAAAVFGNNSPGFLYVQFATALILVLAANTAFNGFPVLGSILAQDRYLPRQLRTRGDRLVYSNGILLLAGFACLLIVAFKASPTRLIQLYIIGVFVSFATSQTGMVRHWTRLLRTERDPVVRRRMFRSRVINGIGASFTATVLAIVLVTKFAKGAWIVVVAMPLIFLTMRAIRSHYDNVSVELVPDAGEVTTLPARTHAVVLVSKIHKPTLRALAYARATRPSTLVALTVNVDDDESRQLQEEWDARQIPVPLVLLDSPYREITDPVLDYVKSIRLESPRDVVIVYVPQYVVGHWWERALHNQSAFFLRNALFNSPNVMVTSVPYQLSSAKGAGGGRGSGGAEVRRFIRGPQPGLPSAPDPEPPSREAPGAASAPAR